MLTEFISLEQSLKVLRNGLDREKIDFDPVLAMAAEYFIHLGVASEQRFSQHCNSNDLCGSYASRGLGI